MRIDQRLDPRRPAHPGLRPYGLHPVSEARDEAEVLLDMLLAHPAGRDDAAGRKPEGRTEDRLGLEYALSMLSGQSIRLFWKTSCRHWGFLGWHR